MKRAILLAVTLALPLCACKREPTFDERYDAASEKISKTSKEIDARLAATGTPQAEASEVVP